MDLGMQIFNHKTLNLSSGTGAWNWGSDKFPDPTKPQPGTPGGWELVAVKFSPDNFLDEG